MKQANQNTYPFSQQWVEEMVRIIQDTAESQGIKPALSYLLQTFINAVMEKEREIYLKEHSENSANGLYNRVHERKRLRRICLFS